MTKSIGLKAVTASLCLLLFMGSAAFAFEVNDAHFHLTNYIQRGPSAKEMLDIMGDRVGRTALFGLPLQQKWDYSVSGDQAPSYYLHSDSELYYYSFVDAMIAQEYLRLSPKERQRFDPMITGFNPTDMYAVDHIRRVLAYYPGVFTGIGEFSINKEFVSAKIAGGAASLRNRAFDGILEFAAETGLLVILHTDISSIISPLGETPSYLEELKRVFRAHSKTSIIWAHTGLGRVVKPSKDHVKQLRDILSDKDYSHVVFDISWDEVAKYVVAGEENLKAWASLINDYPDRFLFGTDAVAPKDQKAYLKTYNDYDPLWPLLSPDAALKVKKTNYERLFDAARLKVRAWEKKQLKTQEDTLRKN